MKMTGKKLVTYAVTIMCLVFICGAFLPLAGADAADTTPPVTNASPAGTAGANGWYISNVTVTLTATDDSSGVDRTRYSLDNVPYTNYTSSILITEGTHSLLYYSIDKSGNSEAVKQLSIKVDTTRPQTNITIKGNLSNGWYNSTVTVNLNSSDATSTVWQSEYSFDNVNWMPYTGNFTIGDGAHKLYYGCYDNAGWSYNNSTTVNVSDPQVEVKYSGTNIAGNWYSSDVQVSFIYDPARVAHVDYSYDKKNWITENVFTNNTEGFHNFYYRVVDVNGITSSIKSPPDNGFGIDKTPPSIGYHIDGKQDKKNGWWNGGITFYVDASDAGHISLTQYSWDKKSWTTYTGPIKINGPSKTIYFRTFDIANRPADSHQWLYFAPGSYDQGGMSNQVYINGATTGPSSGTGTATAVPIPSTVPVPTPTQVPMPTPTYVPADTGNDLSSGSGAPLAVAVLVGVLVLLGIIAAAAYLFVFKPK